MTCPLSLTLTKTDIGVDWLDDADAGVCAAVAPAKQIPAIKATMIVATWNFFITSSIV